MSDCLYDKACVSGNSDDNVTSLRCRSVIGTYCPLNPLDERCFNALLRNLNRDDICDTSIPIDRYDTIGLKLTQDVIVNTTDYLYSKGIKIGYKPNGTNYSPYYSTLYDKVCKDNPIACAPMLSERCKVYSTSDVKSNGLLGKMCGCYLNPISYTQYVNDYGINKECTPMCKSAIPNVNSDGRGIRCTSNVCVIDNNSINISNSSYGEVRVDQICGNCTGTCLCYIEGNAIKISDSNVDNVVISQVCGDVKCFIGGNEVPCVIYKYNYVLLIVLLLITLISVVLLCGRAFK